MENKLSALFYPKRPFDSLYIPAIYKSIWIDGLYIDVLNGRTDMVIVELGANVGIVADHMRAYAKKVYSVEPENENFESLKANKEWNSWDNVEIFHAAMWDKDGEETLHVSENNRTACSLTAQYNKETQGVKTYAMDTFFKENNIEKVDFMKMDIEGSEEKVLMSEGFLKVVPQIETLMVEFHSAGWERLVDHLVSLGFKTRRPMTDEVLIFFYR